jgi:hypothetical protein
MAQIQTTYNNPDIEAYRLGLLSDTQGLIRNQQLGRQVQGLRGQVNPATSLPYTDAEIAQLLSTPGSGTEGEEGYVAPTNYDPAYISSISQDAVFQPPAFQVAGLNANQTDAIELASRGVGSYKPYIQQGSSTLNQGIGSVNAGRNMVSQGTTLGGVFAQEGMNDLQNAGIRSQMAAGQYATGMTDQAALTQGELSGLGDQALASGAQTGATLGGLGTGAQFIAGQAGNQLTRIGSGAQGVADRAIAGGANVLGNQRAGLAQAEGMMNQAVAGGQAGLGTATSNARGLKAPLQGSLASSTQGGLTAAQQGQLGADQASFLARQSTAAAQNQLTDAANFGLGTAKSGIAQLAGASAEFDPTGIGAYNSPYQDEVVAATLADLERVAARRQQAAEDEVARQAVSAGAFGSSGYQRAMDRSIDPIREELDRNTASTIAQLRSQGYESSAQRAMAAFEAARNRQLQTAQTTGQLGQAGAATSANAAQAGGSLGLGAEQLAQGSALQGAKLGLDANQMAAANAQALASTGLSIEQLASQNAEAGARLGMSGAQFKAANETALAQTGMSVEQLAASTGMNATQLAGTLAQQAGALGLQGNQLAQGATTSAGNAIMQGINTASSNALQGGQMGIAAQQGAGNLRLAGENQAIGAASNYANLGLDYGSMNQAGGAALGNLGSQLGTMGIQQAGLGELEQSLRRNDISDLLTTGGIQQTNDQAVLDAIRMTDQQSYQLPFQETGFLSDIYAGVPTSASTVTSGSTSSASPFMQAATLGIGGLSAAAGASRAGLF